MIKAPKISSKRIRPAAITEGTVPKPKPIGWMKGTGMNKGGLPNNMKNLFPKSSRAIPQYGNGGKVISSKCGC
jgi:hypothetical protein